MMEMFVVYDSPRDYPGRIVVRKWRVAGHASRDENLGVTYVGGSLDEARAAIPAGLVCMNRDAIDDPVIMETWL